MKIADLLTKELFLSNVKVKNKKDLFDYCSTVLQKTGFINNRKDYIKALLKRETEFSTGMKDGFAIPHAQADCVTKATVVFGKLEKPLNDWKTFDNNPVTHFFMLVVPKSTSGDHMVILGNVARLLMDDKFIVEIKTAETYEVAIKVINKYESKLS